MKAWAVIGANFGDEGKGLMTDYLCRTEKVDAVIRFNGGAQAGHTVQLPDGRRHVFHHYGSGTLSGVPTYLSQNFICNPYLFETEKTALHSFGQPIPAVHVYPHALVTTPYDMLLNQKAEEARGSGRHGSCGVGIRETQLRHVALSETKSPEYSLYVDDLLNPERLLKILDSIRRYYVPRRAKELGLSDEATAYCMREVFIDSFVDRCEKFIAAVKLSPLSSLEGLNVVFEGAQGLALDQNNHEYFPYLTPSNTGSTNIALMCQAMSWIKSVDIFYMTRSYLTRHGAGPLPDECSREELSTSIVDPTNVPHDFQGTLRYAPLSGRNLADMHDRISKDLSLWKDNSQSVRENIVVTCVDQMTFDVNLLAHPALSHISTGPTWEDLVRVSVG